MKKLLFFCLLVFVVTGLHATKYNPITSYVNSVEINNVTGVFQFTVNYLFLDSVSLINNIEIIAPDETTDALAGGETPFAFISMYDVDWVKIYGNTFRNTYALADPVYLGNGINIVDSKCNITSFCNSGTFPCTSQQPNQFVNLHYGIKASASSSTIPLTINNNVFDRCHFGVYLSTIDYATVINNEFIVSDWINYYTKMPQYAYGLYLNQSKHFHVEGNNFSSFDPISQRGWTGIYVNNCNIGNGHITEEIYRNNFDDLFSAIVAQNANGGIDDKDGLTFHCNNFVSNSYDISVLPKTNVNTSISQVQGVQFGVPIQGKLLVRNKYSADCTPNDENQFKIDWYPGSEEWIFHASCSNPECLPTSSCKDQSVQVLNSGIAYSDDLCPNKTAANPAIIKQDLIQIAATKNDISNLIDGGETVMLVSIAQSSIPEGQLLQTMLVFSPYLSDDVLLALIERPSSLSPGVMQQILSANSPLSDEVYLAMQKMQPPLPKGIRNQIAALQTSELSDRDIIPVIEASYSQSERILTADLIRYYLNDTLTVSAMDSVKKILEQATVRDAKLNLVSAYIETKHFVKASSLIDSLRTIDNSLVTFADKQTLSISVADLPGKDYSILSDSVQMNSLRIMATDTLHYGAMYAMNTLELLQDTRMEEQTLIPELDVNNRSMIGMTTIQSANGMDGFINCYPNPASEKFTVHYETAFACDEMYLVMQNIKGQEVKRISINNCEGSIEMESPSESGTYYLFIESCGQILSVDKMVILH